MVHGFSPERVTAVVHLTDGGSGDLKHHMGTLPSYHTEFGTALTLVSPTDVPDKIGTTCSRFVG